MGSRTFAAAALAVAVFGRSASATDYRFEASVGPAYAQAEATARVFVSTAQLNLSSDALAGPGLAPGAQFWVDGLLSGWLQQPFWDNVSFGVEYRYFTNSASTSLGAIVPTAFEPISATATLHSALAAHNVMINAAWRYNAGDLHPFVGGGGGVTLTELQASVGLVTIPVISGVSPTTLNSEAIAVSPSGQVFAGLDYDLGSNVYVGLTGEYHVTDSISRSFTHTRYDVNTNELAILGHVGVKF